MAFHIFLVAIISGGGLSYKIYAARQGALAENAVHTELAVLPYVTITDVEEGRVIVVVKNESDKRLIYNGSGPYRPGKNVEVRRDEIRQMANRNI